MKMPKCLYYITHKDNLKSILKRGILSRTHSNIFSKILRIGSTPIHSEDIVQIRQSKHFRNKTLWNYVNLYFQARNPMLYRVINKFGVENIIVLEINSSIIQSPDAGITDGNAASQNTEFFEDVDKGLQALDSSLFEKSFWTDLKDGKRRVMAEVLIYEKIPKEKITAIYTANQQMADQIKCEMIGGLNVIPNPQIFFLPKIKKYISDKITLLKEDMFFSKMQTFTISVNTVGVMGKGLASRAKYQFPDVYVLYQDICRQKKLKMGVPFLYKRTENFVKTLMEDTSSAVTENGHRWFLLFPTKNHWKEKSPIGGIEQGLKWLLNNYKNQKIESLALPALGCGLGSLSWAEVGPLMCKYLNQMDIKSDIYLPLEKNIPPHQLEPQFLLRLS